MAPAFQLPFRPPYDWPAVRAFLAARATPGVEAVDDTSYRRAIALDGHAGSIRVSPAATAAALDLEIRFAEEGARAAIADRVSRVFDLGADPGPIAKHLRNDPALSGPLGRHPGIRTPGAWDGFEIGVRAILGQQVSVAAATTFAGRLASMFGTATEAGPPLTRLFPTPIQLAEAGIERAGVIRSRAGAIRALARAVLDGRVRFDAGDGSALVDALTALPGIGPWTAQYIAMRAAGDPDAFVTGDLVLRRMMGGCTSRELEAHAERWRPWRAYAVMLLWQEARDGASRPPSPAGTSPAPRARRSQGGSTR